MNLKDAIGKDVFLFEGRQYTNEDFMKMSSEELGTFKAKVNLKITNVADIIKERQELESKDWYKRRKFVLSLYNKMIPYINSLLNQRYKMERNLSDYFMDQARLLLSIELYEMILINAQREYRIGRGGPNARN